MRKKCLIILYYLTTLHYQALKQAINNNVKHVFRTFGIVNSQFWFFLTFKEDYIIITKMKNILLHVFKIENLFRNKSRKPPSTRMTLNIGCLFWGFWNSLCVFSLRPTSTHLNWLFLQRGYVANFHDSNLFPQDFQTQSTFHH